MDNSKSEARVLAEAALSAASQCRAVKQRINAYVARTSPSRSLANERSDGEKYRWIRGNRGNHAIPEALAHSDRNKDFDDSIDAAMALSDRCAPPSPAVPTGRNDLMELPDEHGQLHLVNGDFLAARLSCHLSSPSTGTSRLVECHFDDATDAICFCVDIGGTLVHASIDASVLKSHYDHAAKPMVLFQKHSPALLEAVSDRISGGSIELIVLREYDLK